MLSSFNSHIQEAELRTLCDCTPFGTDALKTVDAARQLGFMRTARYTLTFEELKAVTDGHQYPIVFVDLGLIDGIEEIHALVVVGIGDTSVTVYDPLQGERLLSRQTFSTAWAMRHNLAIVVEK